MVAPGAFADSLGKRGVAGIKLLFQHDANQPIGVWTELREDARGLYARGRLMPEVAKAREVLALMRAGALDGLSIGFRTVKGRRDRAQRRAAAGEGRSLGDLGRHLSAAAGGARRRREVAALRRAAADRTRIRTLAHAGCWADAKRGARRDGRGLSTASRPCGMRARERKTRRTSMRRSPRASAMRPAPCDTTLQRKDHSMSDTRPGDEGRRRQRRRRLRRLHARLRGVQGDQRRAARRDRAALGRRCADRGQARRASIARSTSTGASSTSWR